MERFIFAGLIVSALAAFWFQLHRWARSEGIYRKARRESAETLQRQFASSAPADVVSVDEATSTTQNIKILMDVYSIMQRRIEHYRQLGISLVFGFFVLFSIIDSVLLREDTDKIPGAEDILILSFIVLAMLLSHNLLYMIQKNFMEAGFIIQQAENLLGLYRYERFGAGQFLLVPDWPTGNRSRDELEGRVLSWDDDVIPRIRHIIMTLGLAHGAYVGWAFGVAGYTNFVSQGLCKLLV